MDRPLAPRLTKPFADRGKRGPLMRGQLGALPMSSEEAESAVAYKRQGAASICIGPEVAKPAMFAARGFQPGRAVFEADGIALVIGTAAGHRRTPFAIVYVTRDPNGGRLSFGPNLKVALEGWLFHKREDEQMRRLGAITERLVELRSGGWHLHEHHRVCVPGPSEHVHGASIHHPLTEQLAYDLPDVLSPRPRRAFAQMAVIEKALAALPDSPLMLAEHESHTARFDTWNAYFATDFDRLARLAIARYPTLPVTEALALAEVASNDPSAAADPAGALDRARVPLALASTTSNVGPAPTR